jgi:hypothetical protein
LILCYNCGMDRTHDIQMIESMLRNPNITSEQTKKLKQQLDYIKNESTKIKSMRAALIKAHQEGNVEEINDIRNFTESHREYRNS